MFTLCMSRAPRPALPQDNAQLSPKYVEKMKKQVKEGYLLRYKKGFFFTGWCEEWMVLYEDSTLAWYADKTLCRLRGYVHIGDAPELLAVAEWTKQVPRKPKFPKKCHIGQLLAIGCTKRHDVHWLMGQTPSEINDWMTAISNTLPPPPNIPFEDTRLGHVQKPIANGYAKPISNGCATVIPNGHCSPVPSNLPAKITTGTSKPTYARNRTMDNYVSKPGRYSNDHTVLAGVVLDWGHGWGWTTTTQTPAIVPQISLATEAFSSSFYCHTADDYTMTGLDDFDWSAFGDFCF